MTVSALVVSLISTRENFSALVKKCHFQVQRILNTRYPTGIYLIAYSTICRLLIIIIERDLWWFSVRLPLDGMKYLIFYFLALVTWQCAALCSGTQLNEISRTNVGNRVFEQFLLTYVGYSVKLKKNIEGVIKKTLK